MWTLLRLNTDELRGLPAHNSLLSRNSHLASLPQLSSTALFMANTSPDPQGDSTPPLPSSSTAVDGLVDSLNSLILSVVQLISTLTMLLSHLCTLIEVLVNFLSIQINQVAEEPHVVCPCALLTSTYLRTIPIQRSADDNGPHNVCSLYCFTCLSLKSLFL